MFVVPISEILPYWPTVPHIQQDQTSGYLDFAPREASFYKKGLIFLYNTQLEETSY